MTPGEHALAEAARLETARVYGTTCPEHKMTNPGPTECSGCRTPFTPTAARHHRRSGSGMCRACQNAARHDNIILLPRLVAHIEQARARGLNVEQTAAAVGVDVAKVRAEWARQDALNAEVATL